MCGRQRRTQVDGRTGAGRLLKVELLSLDCAKCDALEQQLLRVLRDLDLAAQVLKTDDRTAFALYWLQDLPAIAINGQVVLQGQLPSDAELYSILTTYRSREPEWSSVAAG